MRALLEHLQNMEMRYQTRLMNTTDSREERLHNLHKKEAYSEIILHMCAKYSYLDFENAENEKNTSKPTRKQLIKDKLIELGTCLTLLALPLVVGMVIIDITYEYVIIYLLLMIFLSSLGLIRFTNK